MASVSKPTTNFGGYDYKFVKNVSAYTCQICCKVYHDPHLTGCCGQHYCESCLNHSLRAFGKQRCPHCRAEDGEFNHIRDLNLKRKISTLDIHCTHWELGCSWVGQVKFLGSHLKEVCGYESFACPLNSTHCGKIFRKDLHQHTTTKCPLRKVCCKHCGVKGTYQWIMEIHYYQCENITIPCPNGCGQQISQVSTEIEWHNKVCSHAVIEYPFAKVGCKEQLIRSKIDKHQNESIQLHLLYTMQSLQSEREKSELERKRNQVMVEKMRAVANHIDSLFPLCSAEQQQPLQSIRSVLDDQLYSLKAETDKVYLRIESCSTLKEKQWISPPFYIYLHSDGDYGYKMCVGITANGNVTLYLLKGEYDHCLIWPLRHALKLDRWLGIQVSLINLKLKQKMEQSRSSIAGRLLNLKYFSKEKILSCQRVHGSEDNRHCIETIHLCDDFASSSVDDAIELSLCYHFS